MYLPNYFYKNKPIILIIILITIILDTGCDLVAADMAWCTLYSRPVRTTFFFVIL